MQKGYFRVAVIVLVVALVVFAFRLVSPNESSHEYSNDLSNYQSQQDIDDRRAVEGSHPDHASEGATERRHSFTSLGEPADESALSLDEDASDMTAPWPEDGELLEPFRSEASRMSYVFNYGATRPQVFRAWEESVFSGSAATFARASFHQNTEVFVHDDQPILTEEFFSKFSELALEDVEPIVRTAMKITADRERHPNEMYRVFISLEGYNIAEGAMLGLAYDLFNEADFSRTVGIKPMGAYQAGQKGISASFFHFGAFQPVILRVALDHELQEMEVDDF